MLIQPFLCQKKRSEKKCNVYYTDSGDFDSYNGCGRINGGLTILPISLSVFNSLQTRCLNARHSAKSKKVIVPIRQVCYINDFQNTSIQIDFHFFVLLKHCSYASRYHLWHNQVRSIWWNTRKNISTKNIGRGSSLWTTGRNLA